MKDKHTFSNTYESSSTTGLDSSSAFCKQITEWYLEPVLTAGAQIQPQKMVFPNLDAFKIWKTMAQTTEN